MGGLTIALAGLSMLSYPEMLRLAKVVTGSGNPIKMEEYSMLGPRLRFAAAFYGLLTLLLWRVRVWCFRIVLQARASLVPSLRQSLIDVRSWSREEPRVYLIALGIIQLVGIGLRLHYISEPIRYDEAFTFLNFGGRSPWHALALYPTPNNHIFHSVLVNLCFRLFGSSLYAIRLPALLAGILVLPCTYVVARRLYDGAVALLATAFVAGSGPLVLYSVNARGYTLFVLFSLVLLWIASDIVQSDSPTAWTLFTGVAIAGFWTMPIMAFAYSGVFLWMLMTVWQRAGGKQAFRWANGFFLSAVAVVAGVVALYMPAAIVSGPNSILRNPWVRPLGWRQFLQQFPQIPGKISQVLRGGLPEPLYIILLVCFAISVVGHRRLANIGAHLFWPMAAACWGVIMVQRTIPYARVFLYLQPMWAMGASAGLLWLCRLPGARTLRLQRQGVGIAAGIAVLWCAASVVSSREIPRASQLSQASDIAARLHKELRSGDCVLSDPQVYYYLFRQGIHYQDYVVPTGPPPRRVFTVTQELPSRGIGEGLLDSSEFSFEGQWRSANLDLTMYEPRESIYFDKGVNVDKNVLRLSLPDEKGQTLLSLGAR